MATLFGSGLWKMVKSPGVPKKFATPQDLWEAACAYFKFCDENPRCDYEQRRGRTPRAKVEFDDVLGEEVVTMPDGNVADEFAKRPVKRPYVEEQLCAFIGVNTWYLNNLWNQLRDEDPHKDGFKLVIKEIKNIIRGDQLEGAITGQYKDNFVARLQGVADASKHEHSGPGGKPIEVNNPVNDKEFEKLYFLKYGKLPDIPNDDTDV